MKDLAIIVWVGSSMLLALGTEETALGLGIWLGITSIGLLVLWVGDQITRDVARSEN